MNGQVLANTPIVVDYWKNENVHPRSLFFLTHMHADHTEGLTEYWSQPIHCTPISAKLLKRKFNVNPNLIFELEYEEPKILRVKVSQHVAITVTAIDANHCPGSAMFLFEGYFGTILYTGDFRFCPTMLQNPSLNGGRAIDVLYLDNTYCDSECTFPSREEATESIIQLISEHPGTLVLIGLYTLGKESLLVEVACRLQEWVWVSEDRYETFELLEMPNVFTRDREKCRILTYMNYFITKGLAPEMTAGEDYIAILPTCQFTGRAAPSLPTDNPRVKVIEYSDHSNFDELWQFVAAIKPRRIIPIVHGFKDSGAVTFRCNMSVFDELLDLSQSPARTIPDGIKNLFSPHYAPSKTAPMHFKTKQPIAGLRTTNKQTPKGIQYLSPQKPSVEEEPIGASPSLVKAEDHLGADPSLVKAEDPLGVSPSQVKAATHSEVCNQKKGKHDRWNGAASCARLIPHSDISKLKEKAQSELSRDASNPEQADSEVPSEGKPAPPRETESPPNNVPYLRTLSIPISSPSDIARKQKVLFRVGKRRKGQRCKEPEFLKSFPYEGIKKMALKNGSLSPLEKVVYPKLVHNWGTGHRIDKKTNMCTCSKRQFCMLSMSARFDELSSPC